jgi:hypothetical protein
VTLKTFNDVIGGKDKYRNLDTWFGGFNDVTSSIRIYRGKWKFYKNADFDETTAIKELGPGSYDTNTLVKLGFPDDSLSSLRRTG